MEFVPIHCIMLAKYQHMQVCHFQCDIRVCFLDCDEKPRVINVNWALNCVYLCKQWRFNLPLEMTVK